MPPPAQSLFYKAQHEETGNMWDVWLYHNEGTYFLYYLANAGVRVGRGSGRCWRRWLLGVARGKNDGGVCYGIVDGQGDVRVAWFFMLCAIVP